MLRTVDGGADGCEDNDVVVGVFRTAEAFVQEALKAKHPVDDVSSVPEIVLNNIDEIIRSGPVAISKKRLFNIGSWLSWSTI